MIIADTIQLMDTEVSDEKTEKLVVFARDVAKSYDAVSHLKNRKFKDRQDKHGSWVNPNNGIALAHEELKDEFEKTCANLLFQSNTLPPSLIREDSFISKVAKSPRVLLGEVRRLADILGFVVIPFEYMNPQAYASESWQLRDAISSFDRANNNSGLFRTYALCPIPYYSVERHVKAKDDLPVYAPPSAAQAFMALAMSIPMFRSLLRDQKDLENRLDMTRKELATLALRVEQLASQMQVTQRTALLAEHMANEALKSAERFHAMDPILFGVPLIRSDDSMWATVGPFWGPDLPEIVAAAMDLPKIAGQRVKLLKAASVKGYCRS